MGGGGLRLLPHKKWNVWRRDNIERVLRDEREHEEKQQELSSKEQRIEQERRAEQLLGRESKQEEHINFFQVEEALANSKKAATTGKKKNGADDTLRRHGRLPWYAQTEKSAKIEPTARQERKRKRELEVADPMQHMRPKKERVVVVDLKKDKRRGYTDEQGPAGSDRRKYSARYDRSSSSGRHLEKEHKRLKKRKYKLKLSKKDLLKELRRERDEREASERQRAEQLLNGSSKR
ncbi:hypothetical protein P3T76_008268 [Phytophthora citrophthora]|uniref:CBF1-interacting co-repressor CIR N-terminal domain-containing protein n=1 Tax=Phytophthora citrophthora TaxID=4793 RepID=A0AAD9GK46_9STRA|nr:hypothetical protein P3T76_008268 [Phytophthora citrophthora]